MCQLKVAIAACLLLYGAATVVSQSSITPAGRCFQFTWLGPRYNNESVFMNATCQDATLLANNVPCQEPLVVSDDGTWPDVDYIWRNHPEHATCAMASNDVCAQYTYYFDGHVENSTYMCTRAIDNEGAAITSGCFRQVEGSFETRVCFCRSIPNGVPCNDASHETVFAYLIFLAIMFNMRNVFLNALNVVR